MNTTKTKSLCKSHGGVADERILLQNYVISKLNRRDLEDRYYSIWNNNISLKKRLNSLNEKIKFLNTKLARLTNQQKKDSIISNKCCKNFEILLKEKDYRNHQLQKLNYDLLEKIEILEEKSKINSIEDEEKDIVDLFELESKNWERDYFELSDFETIDKQIDIVDTRLEPIRENNVEHVEEKLLFLEKEIETLKTENKTYLKEEIYKENESKTKFQDAITQSDGIDLYIKMENSNENEYLKNKLDEQFLKVEELQRELESNKLKQNILDIVQSKINNSNKNDTTMNTKEIEKIENKLKILEKELFEMKLCKESLELVNNDLSNQVLQLQSKNDYLLIENQTLQMKKVNHMENEKNGVCENSKNSQKINKSSINGMSPKDKNYTPQFQVSELSVPDNMITNSKLYEKEINNTSISEHIGEKSEFSSVTKIKNIPEINIDENKCKENENNSNASLVANKNQIESDVHKELLYCNNDPLISEKSDTESDSKSECNLPLNDVTYDISLNSSSDRSHTPLESSEGYLSDGEVRKDTVMKMPQNLNKNSEFLYSNTKKGSSVTKFIPNEITMKQTIDDISKEMEKCEQLMNLKYRKELQTIENVKSNFFRSNGNLDMNDKVASFTLHITSVELTDKAISSLQSNLYFLTWKFYNEVVAYTPLCQNQISIINFSSTYNINMDNDFLTYLCNKSIQIDISEMKGESSVFFAFSEICLVEILDNVNNKVELKLNLKKNKENLIEDNITVGIINCWCKLTI